MSNTPRRLIPVTPTTPVACTLTPDAAVRRAGEVRALAASALLRSERAASTLVLRFERSPEIEEAVEALAAAEQECCAFLTLAVERDGDEVVLRIEAPDGADAVLDTFEELAVRS